MITFCSPGPNAPLEWMKRCVETLDPKTGNQFMRSKILMGLNFYGYQYSYLENRAVVRHELGFSTISIIFTAYYFEDLWILLKLPIVSR